MKAQINELLAAPPALTSAKERKAFAKWKAEVEAYLKQLPVVVEKLRAWDPNKPVPAYGHYLFSVWHAVDHGKFLAGLCTASFRCL